MPAPPDQDRRHTAMDELLRAFAALLVVLAAILGLAYMMRRLAAGRISADGRQSDLGIVEWRGLDARRKLAVIRWDGREHLMCLGPSNDCVLASRPAPDQTETDAPESDPPVETPFAKVLDRVRKTLKPGGAPDGESS